MSRETVGRVIAGVVGVYCLLVLVNLSGAPGLGWAHVTVPLVSGLGLAGAYGLVRGWRDAGWMLMVWAVLQVPVWIVDPSGSLVGSVVFAGWTKTQTMSVNDVVVQRTGYGMNWAGLGWVVLAVLVMGFRLHAEIKPFQAPAWVSRVWEKVLPGRRGTAVIALFAVVLFAVWWWWPQPAQEDVIAEIGTDSRGDEVYLGEHYLGRTPLVITKQMVAGLKTRLGNGDGVRVCFDSNWGECFFAYTATDQERITIKPSWWNVRGYATYPTPAGDRVRMNRSWRFGGDEGKLQRAMKNLAGSKQAMFQFDTTVMNAKPGDVVHFGGTFINGAKKEVTGESSYVFLSLAPFEGRWAQFGEGKQKSEAMGRVCSISNLPVQIAVGANVRLSTDFEAPTKPGVYRVRGNFRTGKVGHAQYSDTYWSSVDYAMLVVK
jgi:hypothetical protein